MITTGATSSSGSSMMAAGRLAMGVPREVLILLLKAYRRIISPMYGQVCRFFPSCSAYALEAVTIHGAVSGSWIAVRRLVRCHPWNSGGVDHVPGAHRHREFAGGIPRIVQLNHPEKYIADQCDADGRSAA